ncbi:hypothetical protein C9890_0689 [Perkinsus sp. BL_2016]|nr:hypothetical protein C9890_0689 [Perkinsus sp. BL_2016]
MNLPNLTVNLVHSGGEVASDAEIKIFLGGKHDNITFGTQNQSIFLISDSASFVNTEFKFITATKFPPEIVQSILNAKPILTPSDVHYLLSTTSNIIIINQEDVDKILNIIIYLKLLSTSPVDVEILKAPNIKPSSIEPLSKSSPVFITASLLGTDSFAFTGTSLDVEVFLISAAIFVIFVR